MLLEEALGRLHERIVADVVEGLPADRVLGHVRHTLRQWTLQERPLRGRGGVLVADIRGSNIGPAELQEGLALLKQKPWCNATLGEVLSDRGAPEEARRAAARLVEAEARRHRDAILLPMLNSGEVAPGSSAFRETSDKAVKRARAMAKEARVGTLVRKRQDGYGTIIGSVVGELYPRLVLFYVERPHLLLEEHNSEEPRGNAWYPRALMELLADLVTGTWGMVIGVVTPTQVTRHVQYALEADPDWRRSIEENVRKAAT